MKSRATDLWRWVKLDRVAEQDAEHRPEHVHDRPCLGKLFIGQKDAAPALLLGLRVRLDRLQLLDRLVPRVEGGAESGLVGADARVSEQRFIVDPVKGDVLVRAMLRARVDRQGEEVALLPAYLVAPDPGHAPASDDMEQFRSGVGIGLQRLPLDDPDEVRTEHGTARRPFATECLAQIRGNDPRRSLLNEGSPGSRPAAPWKCSQRRSDWPPCCIRNIPLPRFSGHDSR